MSPRHKPSVWRPLNEHNCVFCSAVPVCSQLCTNSFAGEGLGGIAGGGFVISTWDGAGAAIWSETSSSTLEFVLDEAGFFLFSLSKRTEIEAVCVTGWDRMGLLCGGEEVGGGDPVVWVLCWGSTQELRCAGGSGMVTGVSVREDTLRSFVLALLVSFETTDSFSCWTVFALVSEYE